MYQFSLTYFKKLFGIAIQNSQKSNFLEERIINIMDSITKLMFTDICRGLFESHKKIYSFLICTSIRRQNKTIGFTDWNYLIRGTAKQAKTPNPDPSFISQLSWDFLSGAQQNCVQLKGIVENVKTNIKQWKIFAKDNNLMKSSLPEFFSNVSPFTRLILTRGLSPQKIMKQFSNYVLHQMGSFFDEIKTTTIDQIYNTSDYKTPMIFILSTGADPTSALIKFAHQKGKQLSVISLGQGQGKKAQKLINRSKAEGSWVLLTNCHLAKSWMPSLQKIVLQFQQNYTGNDMFRLMLTSMPAEYFPVPILQNGSKLTLEPPRGLKSNLKKSFTDLNDKFFKQCQVKNKDWHKLVFTLSFFHAIIQQRRKFGPLGFNIRYEFNDSDLSIAFATLKMFLDTQDQNIPWDAMLYMTGHINYGGRVTDDWDRVCLLSILKKYYNQEILNTQKYQLSASKIYYVPEYGNLKNYHQHINKLPNFQDPEVFGMHQNANITYQNQQSTKIMQTILSIQPRVSSGGTGGKSPDQIVIQMADEFQNLLPQILNKSTGNQQHFVTNQSGNMHSLSIVLIQEIQKFNNLLGTLKKTLGQLKKAIKGFAVMSQQLDQMYLAFQNNVLPGLWKKVSFASLKPLASWFKDMINRVEFLRSWLDAKNPFSYWMSGFYFPQGFLTGVLQAHSRLYKIPIDTLSFKFKVLAIDNKQKLTAPPQNGVYVDGLFLDGARWDSKQDSLADQVIGKLYFPMPIIHFLPAQNYGVGPKTYRCPCYKTSNRAGVLSTTGQSTNFILPVDLPSKHMPSEFWTLRGTALLSQLDD